MLGTAQRIVLMVGVAAVLGALGRYLETLGQGDLAFGWFAYAPLDSTVPTPGALQPRWVHPAIWAGASVVWALAAIRLAGSAWGRRIVLVVALAGVLIGLGSYLSTFGSVPDRPGLQFLSSEQLSQYGSRLAPWAQLLVWSALAVVWTVSAFLLLSRAAHSRRPGS